ncbi:MAG: hypothetical protein R2857_00130 [Vampirovibrionales bacterium]
MRQFIETNGGLNGLIDQYIDSGLPPVHPQLLQDLECDAGTGSGGGP